MNWLRCWWFFLNLRIIVVIADEIGHGLGHFGVCIVVG
jgi:hypothetical protein